MFPPDKATAPLCSMQKWKKSNGLECDLLGHFAAIFNVKNME